MGLVYLAKNILNGKCYVGKTVHSLGERRKGHQGRSLSGSNTHFHRALAKYGPEAFEWSVLDECDNEKVLNALERLFIRRLNTRSPNGYNLTDGGEGVSGWIPTEQWRSVKRMHGKHHSEEAKKRIGKSNLGKNKGKPSPWKGHVPSPETCLKMSLAKVGYVSFYREAMKKRRTSDEFIKAHQTAMATKGSATVRALWKDPEFRKRNLEARIASRKAKDWDSCSL